MDTVLQDVRYALRGLVSRPTFSVIVLATLALGIGANAAIFSVVNAVVLEPLPYANPDRLVRFWPDFLFYFDIRDATHLYEESGDRFAVAVYGRSLATFTGGSEAEVVRGAAVSPNHFDVLGTPALHGRTFLPEEGSPGSAQVIVLSYGLWQRRYGSDLQLIGNDVEISGRLYRVVGVMPPGHQAIEEDWQFWRSLQLVADSTNESALAVIARLAPGVSAEQATADAQRIMRAFWESQGQELTDEDMAPLRAAPIAEWMLGDVASQLLILLGAVGFVLLIACANVANLLLAQGTARRRELVVRSALGAGRGRLIRQLLTESVVLGIGGGVLGLGLAWTVLQLGVASLPPQLPRVDNIGIDTTVLGVVLVASLLSSLAFGLAPALRAVGGCVEGSLSQIGRSATIGARQLRLNNGLVMLEVAVAVILVVGAGLMLRSFQELSSVDPGFQPEGLVTLRPAPPSTRYATNEDVRQYHDEVKAALRRMPEVTAVGGIMFLPMTSGGFWGAFFPPDSPPADGEQPERAGMRVIWPGYFDSMRTPRLAGRDFADSDAEDAEPVIIVNETLAQMTWPGEEAVGRQLTTMGSEARIIGVVADVRQTDLETVSHPEIYIPYGQRPWRHMYFTVRVDGDATEALAGIQATVRSVDPQVPLTNVASMQDVVARSVSDSRFFTGLIVSFGSVALILGMIGVYGVTSFIVRQRDREIGIRVALGADTGRLTRQTILRGSLPVLFGVAVGLAAAVGLTRFLASNLHGISALDPVTFTLVPMVLAISALLALYGPARRASRVDPIGILRAD